MCIRRDKTENQILLFSAVLASGFALGGLILGLLVGSLVILFDGVYSSVSLLLTLLSLAVSRYIRTPSDKQFPFGKAILEPLVITVKALVILLIVAVSFYSAVTAMFTGGREVDTGIATIFGLVNVIGCGYGWWYIKEKSRHFSSGLTQAEAVQWQMDTLLSLAITVGFVIAWFISRSQYSGLAVYADPLMMCVISVYFFKVPLDMLKEAVRELLMMSPDKEICLQVNRGIDRARRQGAKRVKLSGLTKVGRELRVNVEFDHLDKHPVTSGDICRARKSIEKQLAALPFDLRLSVNISQ